MHRYAQIDITTGHVISDSWLLETSAENLIPISEDFDLTNKKQDFEIGNWMEYVPEPIELQPSQLDLIQYAVEKSNDELRQEGAEAVTLELIERGIL